MHIALKEDLEEKLKNFSKSRKVSRTNIMNYSLDLLFSLEQMDYKNELALKHAIEHKFVVPKNIPIISFYSFLYLLANKFPGDSSKEFWSETIYRSSLDKSHGEVLAEVKDDHKKFLETKENGRG